MKKTSVIVAATILTLSVHAQKIKDNEVPELVKEAFKRQYSDVKVSEWEMEKGNYEAEFKKDGSEQSVVIDANGKILETEVEIKIDQLPAKVKDYIFKTYKNARIREASKITDSKGTITYEAEINRKDLIFDANGEFIKESAEKEFN